MKNKPIKIIVHHTGGTDLNPLADTSNQTFEIVNDYHKQKWNFISSLGYYIGYHYFLDKTGKITQGRADSDEGAHCIGQNFSSLGICMAGNFDVTMPTKEQSEALKSLIGQKMHEYGISIDNIYPHRKFSNKSCFGHNLSDDWLTKLLKPVEKLIEPCQAERDIIKEKDKQLSNLRLFIKSLLEFLKVK